MNIRMILSCAGMLTSMLSAQSVASKPAYVRVGVALPQADLKAFLGGRKFAPTLEIGHDFKGPDTFAGLGVYASYLTAKGQAIAEYGGLKQEINGLRIGVDCRFDTPFRGLTPFAGLTLTRWSGKRVNGGTVPAYYNYTTPVVLTAGSYPDHKPKFGARAGVEYRFTEDLGMSLDYNFGEWRSEAQVGATVPTTGPITKKGLNPVNPSWVGISFQYRLSTFK